jgi:hypothetical protein
MADDVQPADNAGQGAEATDSGLYDLDSVAPEVREQLVPHLKAIEGNVTKKFQEAAEYRKQWQPYEDLGLTDVKPDELQGLLEFAKNANDPDWFSNWWKQAGDEMGLFEKHASPSTDDLGLDDPDTDLTPEKIQELVAEQVAEKLSPIEQHLQQEEQTRKVEQANEEIGSALSSIEDAEPNLFKGDAEEKEKVQDAIIRLSYAYADDSSLSVEDMIRKGFEDYKQLIGQGEKGLFDQKVEQPQTPEGPGAPSTAPEKITSFDDPRLMAQARERLKHTQ